MAQGWASDLYGPLRQVATVPHKAERCQSSCILAQVASHHHTDHRGDRPLFSLLDKWLEMFAFSCLLLLLEISLHPTLAFVCFHFMEITTNHLPLHIT